MGRKDDLEYAVDGIVFAEMDTRRGYTVPTSETVKLSNGGVYIEAAYLYADMADSTGLARYHTAETSAKIIKAFLSAATRILRHHDGEIRSYDGDRVMAIFIGDDGSTRAVRAALEIKWAVDNIVRPSLRLALHDEYNENRWKLSHRTGIDYGSALIARAGVRNNSDLVSIGDAPNIAAKLSDQKGYRTFISERVWHEASYDACFSNGKPMWSPVETTDIGGGRFESVRHSNWGWVIN